MRDAEAQSGFRFRPRTSPCRFASARVHFSASVTAQRRPRSASRILINRETGATLLRGGPADTLAGVELEGACCSDADLKGADLAGARPPDVDLCQADLRGAVLDGADLRDADVTLANLAGTSFRNAILADARFQGVNMGGAVPARTDFRGAELTRCLPQVLQSVRLRLRRRRHAPDADLTRCDLTGGLRSAPT